MACQLLTGPSHVHRGIRPHRAFRSHTDHRSPFPSKRGLHLSVRASGSASESGSYVVSIGEALFDCLADQKGVPKEQVQSWTPYPGGAPANVATALTKLGTRCVFVSALGRDELGDQMVELLQDTGVDLSHLQRLDRPTRDVLVTRSLGGDREFSGFGAAESEDYADCYIDPARVPKYTIKHASALVTGTLGLACPETAKALHTAVDATRGGGVPVPVRRELAPRVLAQPPGRGERHPPLRAAGGHHKADGRGGGVDAGGAGRGGAGKAGKGACPVPQHKGGAGVSGGEGFLLRLQGEERAHPDGAGVCA